MKNKTLILQPRSPSKSFRKIISEKEHGFTLVELIIVIIIVGILAAVGISQYSLMVEKGRTAEAKVRIGTMRQLAHEYYLNNGTLTGMTNADVGVDGTCYSTDFYYYRIVSNTGTYACLGATRCTSGGKTPNTTRGYLYYDCYYPATGRSVWHCYYTDNSSSCFGLPGCCYW